jgi:hypothetical protein
MSALTLPRYCLVGARPVRALQTADGGMTGEFVRDLSWTERILTGLWPLKPRVQGVRP